MYIITHIIGEERDRNKVSLHGARAGIISRLGRQRGSPSPKAWPEGPEIRAPHLTCRACLIIIIGHCKCMAVLVSYVSLSQLLPSQS